MSFLSEEQIKTLVALACRSTKDFNLCRWGLMKDSYFKCYICDHCGHFKDITNHGLKHLKEYNLLAFT